MLPRPTSTAVAQRPSCRSARTDPASHAELFTMPNPTSRPQICTHMSSLLHGAPLTRATRGTALRQGLAWPQRGLAELKYRLLAVTPV